MRSSRGPRPSGCSASDKALTGTASLYTAINRFLGLDLRERPTPDEIKTRIPGRDPDSKTRLPSVNAPVGMENGLTDDH